METAELKELIEKIKAEIKENMDYMKDPTDEEIEELIETSVFNHSKERYLKISEKQSIIESVFNSMRRLDILQPLLEDESITEIMINGPRDIFIERGGKSQRLEQQFTDEKKLEDVIQSIVAKVNRVVNEASPIVDARLQNGARINAVLPPVALNGPILTIRKFPENPITIQQLVEMGSLTEEAAIFLQRMVEARYNVFISGGTGSGKTTFLNVLSNFIPRDERIITIEDSAELQIKGVENLVKLETRTANVEGKNGIPMRELIKTALRMRPDRIIVGEVRGTEAIDMLQAMNTGHDGSLSTGHANSTKDMLSRLETMVLSGTPLPLEAIRQQIASGIDIIVHLARIRDKSRRVMEITEVVDFQKGKIRLNPLFEFEEIGEDVQKRVIGSLKRSENQLSNTLKLKLAGIKLDSSERD
ncbi:CpaF family protein [Alkaliphilus hydrothermalis]|uniref:Pilus assembly protein CpaF n=1 Tax=Alkaliphilus hydrothermalis TaxID=1482730 RepID=A0ABS2NSB0_9FIRM|nr:CpaF family protein [Alkaliphilus hydrothermalis]MBM7615826.1 pilus assembly protein CpaF [Alkaliphilus hydrothermalis]